MSEQQSRMTIYTRPLCGMSMKVMSHLDAKGIPYDTINIYEDEKASDFVWEVNDGFLSVPTIVFDDKSILTEPSLSELTIKMKELGII